MRGNNDPLYYSDCKYLTSSTMICYIIPIVRTSAMQFKKYPACACFLTQNEYLLFKHFYLNISFSTPNYPHFLPLTCPCSPLYSFTPFLFLSSHLLPLCTFNSIFFVPLSHFGWVFTYLTDSNFLPTFTIVAIPRLM